MVRRGFTIKEVEEAIRDCQWEPSELGRLQCGKEYNFGREWNGKIYDAKLVKPIFVEENDEIVVVTVYTYYVKRGGSL